MSLSDTAALGVSNRGTLRSHPHSPGEARVLSEITVARAGALWKPFLMGTASSLEELGIRSSTRLSLSPKVLLFEYFMLSIILSTQTPKALRKCWHTVLVWWGGAGGKGSQVIYPAHWDPSEYGCHSVVNLCTKVYHLIVDLKLNPSNVWLSEYLQKGQSQE